MNRKKILLVDDVQLFLEQEKTFFGRGDFELMTARSGTEALEAVKGERPDLVFMDLYMPDMDGDQCCHAIKSDDELRKIPVIMVTRGVSEEDFERCWQAGCDDIVLKPINRHYFLSVTNKFLQLRQKTAPRYMAHLRVRYGTDHRELLTDYSVNLSMGGLFIETGNFLPVDTSLGIEFILPDNPAPIRCRGQVVWINHPELLRNPNLPAGMGLQFLEISFDDMNAIRQYIKKDALLPSW